MGFSINPLSIKCTYVKLRFHRGQAQRDNIFMGHNSVAFLFHIRPPIQLQNFFIIASPGILKAHDRWLASAGHTIPGMSGRCRASVCTQHRHTSADAAHCCQTFFCKIKGKRSNVSAQPSSLPTRVFPIPPRHIRSTRTLATGQAAVEALLWAQQQHKSHGSARRCRISPLGPDLPLVQVA